MTTNKLFGSALAILLFSLSSNSQAADEHSNVACPVGLVSGLTLTDEFGAVAAANTRCIKKRHHVRTMFAIDQFYATGSTTQPYALHQMQNVYNDYTITDGMTEGRDFKMIAVVHSMGGMLLLNDGTINPFKAQVEHLMSEGVTFYMCENTVRGFIHAGLLQQGNVAAGLIPGVKFVTAGLSAISDFQALGWSYDQP
ncbi:MAG: hypothetical protein P8180_01190 [Gammaproteobacteria bacterium]